MVYRLAHPLPPSPLSSVTFPFGVPKKWELKKRLKLTGRVNLSTSSEFSKTGGIIGPVCGGILKRSFTSVTVGIGCLLLQILFEQEFPLSVPLSLVSTSCRPCYTFIDAVGPGICERKHHFLNFIVSVRHASWSSWLKSIDIPVLSVDQNPYFASLPVPFNLAVIRWA